MKTEIVSQESNVTVIKAVFPAEEVNAAIDSTYTEMSQKANLKGFRKGHVPRKTIELYFGKNGIHAETIDRIVPDAIEKIIEEYELNLVAEPKVDAGSLEEGKEFDVTVTFEISPEVVLPELESITAEKTIYKTTEEMRDENIKQLLESRAELVPTYEEREINEEDYVSVKYNVSVTDKDGNTTEPEKDQKSEIYMAQPGIREEVKTALLGKKPGDTCVCDFDVEADSKHNDIAGKKMHYEFEIQGILKKEIPVLTDENVHDLTYTNLKTVDEYKASVMKRLEAVAESRSEESLKQSAVAAVIEKSEVEIPQTMIDREKTSIKTEQEDRIKQETNDSEATLESYMEKSNMDKDEYEKGLGTAAYDRIKRSLVLSAVADANDIEWTAEDINLEIKRIALTTGSDPKKVREFVLSDRNRVYEIANMVRTRKTIDFIASKVQVKEIQAEEAQLERK